MFCKSLIYDTRNSIRFARHLCKSPFNGKISKNGSCWGIRMYKLMIVDDELLMRVGIRSMLNWEEYNFYVVGEAGNGKEALSLALEVMPDLIITDIKMPIMDGLQLIQRGLLRTENM